MQLIHKIFISKKTIIFPPPILPIAGLESVRRLQWLSVDHNELISTKGLRDVYTLLHLSCSHNHLSSVEGVENNALLSTLDLRANSLTEVTAATVTTTADHGLDSLEEKLSLTEPCLQRSLTLREIHLFVIT